MFASMHNGTCFPWASLRINNFYQSLFTPRVGHGHGKFEHWFEVSMRASGGGTTLMIPPIYDKKISLTWAMVSSGDVTVCP